MKRIVGRRLITDQPKEILMVTVYRRWPWQQDVFYNDGDIGVKITAGDLMISMPDEAISYNSRHWRKVVSKKISSRAQV